jgi:hypothetical protein
MTVAGFLFASWTGARRFGAAAEQNRFLGIVEAVRGLVGDEALIDGEAVVPRDDGRSDFHALMTKRGGALRLGLLSQSVLELLWSQLGSREPHIEWQMARLEQRRALSPYGTP